MTSEGSAVSRNSSSASIGFCRASSILSPWLAISSSGQFDRLKKSLGDNHPEIILLDTYYSYFFEKLKEKLPALIPQVYLHYDPYTSKQLKGVKRLSRERMDFLLLLPYRKNIVIEIDGKQHYSKNGKANAQLYAKMVAEDRRLRLAGYELYRFGGYEFSDDEKAKRTVKNFFDDLFKLHSIL